MRLRAKGVQLLDEALAGIGAKNAAAKQDTQTAQDRYFAMLLGALPERQRLPTITSNPDWRTKGTVNIPDYQPTELEKVQDQLNLLRAQGGVHALQHPEDTGPGGAPTLSFYNAAGVLPPSDLVKKNVDIGTYQNAASLPPEAVKAQRVQDKLALDANQEREGQQWQTEFAKIKQPESAANIGHVKAMTVEQLAAAGNQRAQAGKNVAETGKIGVETKQLGATDQPIDQTTDQNVKTTVSGKEYVDLTGYTGKDANAMRHRYSAAGLPVVSGTTADAISEIDNARMNQKTLQDMIAAKLPKGPGDRVLSTPGIKLSEIFQTDADRAAYGIARSAAIQTLRAVAGSKGLRINRAEILMAAENDIPQLTDTLDTAKTRAGFINKLLDGTENAHLVRDKSVGAGVTRRRVFDEKSGTFTDQ